MTGVAGATDGLFAVFGFRLDAVAIAAAVGLHQGGRGKVRPDVSAAGRQAYAMGALQ